MNTTKLHDSIKMAYEVDPRHPSLPFMEAATAILEEHELRLGILSGHIILERCKPHEDPGVLSREEVDSLLKATEEWDHEQREDEKPKTLCTCVRCGESAQYGRIYCERCVAFRTTGNLAAPRRPGLEQVTLERGPNSRLTIQGETYVIHPAVGEEIARLRSQVEGNAGLLRYLWRAKEDAAERHVALVCASGEWNVERASLCAQVERLQRERDEALKRAEIDAPLKATEPDEGEDARHDDWIRDVDGVCFTAGPTVRGEEESKGEGGCSGTTQEPGAPASPAGAGVREASSPNTPTLREEVLAFLNGWGVGIGTTCGDAVAEVLGAWEAKHRKLREAAQAVVEEAPHQIEFLWEQGSNGHAASLKRAADRLEAALKETPDATP